MKVTTIVIYSWIFSYYLLTWLFSILPDIRTICSYVNRIYTCHKFGFRPLRSFQNVRTERNKRLFNMSAPLHRWCTNILNAGSHLQRYNFELCKIKWQILKIEVLFWQNAPNIQDNLCGKIDFYTYFFAYMLFLLYLCSVNAE